MSDMAYVCVKPCGCVRGITVDEPHRSKAVAAFVAEMIRAGCTIDHVTVEAARQVQLQCAIHPRQESML